MDKRFNLMFSAMGMIVLLLSSRSWSNAKSELNALTGGIHTRVAWREGGDQIKGGSNTVKGFDSKTGEIHTIWRGDSVVKPVLCSKGNRVLITTCQHRIYVVDWDGQNKKLMVESGMCSDAWLDPATGKEWCVYRPGGTKTGGGVTRCLIDDPGTAVRIWDGSEGHAVYPWFQLSADGKRAASFLPYPKIGIVNLETGKTAMVASKGSWSSMTSGNSYIWFHMRVNHASVKVFKDQEEMGPVNVLPPIEGRAMFGIRAAEGPEKGGRFFSLSGGISGYSKKSNTVEIFVGKFDADFKSVEGWARITNNNEQDHHSTVWIGVEPTVHVTDTLLYETNQTFPRDTNQTETFNPWIKITSKPAGGYTIGDTVNVKWESNDVPVAVIHVSVNNGDWTPVRSLNEQLNPDDDDWENYNWIIPDTLERSTRWELEKVPLAGKNIRLLVACLFDLNICDSTIGFQVVGPANIMFPSYSGNAWSVLPNLQGGVKLYISKGGNHTVRISKPDGRVISKFHCIGGSWHRFKVNQGPGIYLIQVGSGSNNIGRLFVNE